MQWEYIKHFPLDVDPPIRYISYPAHKGKTRQITSLLNGIVSCGASSLVYTNYRGIRQWSLSIKHPNAFVQLGQDLIVGGNELNVVNQYRGQVIQSIVVDSPILKVKKSQNNLYCATKNGQIQVRDGKSKEICHTLNGHTGLISDIDIQGYTIVSCGSSIRGENLVKDPFIKVFDTRMMKPLPPFPTPIPPTLLKLHPKIPSILYSVSPSGSFQTNDLKTATTSQFYQIPTSGFVTCMTMSSSTDVFGFGDNLGQVCNCFTRENGSLHTFPKPIESFKDFSTPNDPLENNVIRDSDPLSVIGMPYYREPLLSSWNISCRLVKPIRIPSDISNSMKMVDFVGYALNTIQLKRNQSLHLSFKQDVVPKFISQKQSSFLSSVSGAGATVSGVGQDASLLGLIVPNHYTKMDIKYSKFGIEDFDFSWYNKTLFSSLENHILNEYINPLLQVLFFNPHLRNGCKSHIWSDCSLSLCLFCELGYLFRNLEDAKGLNCQATNFLKAFNHIPQVAALGLDESKGVVHYGKLIQRVNRFLLEELKRESRSVDNYEKSLESLFAFSFDSITKCQCSFEQKRESNPFVLDLIYEKQVLLGTNSVKKDLNFCQVLEQSINSESFSKAWCPGCKKYERMVQNRILKELPFVLNINTNVGSRNEFTLKVPLRIGISCNSNDELSIIDLTSSNLTHESKEGESKELKKYKLKSIITEIHQDQGTYSLVAHITDIDESKQWYLFNDFLIQPLAQESVLEFKEWKIPCILQYELEQECCGLFEPFKNMDTRLLSATSLLNKTSNLEINYTLPSPNEVDNMGNTLVAIDAEFVSLEKEVLEISSDGLRSVIRPSRLGLARVSCIRGQGHLEGIPFMDDYIQCDEPVVDYLTSYSGIHPGDLDASTSKFPLVSLKTAYKKLRILADLGCIFVGHGLKKDFRIINLVVPKHQVIDTVDIYFIPSKQRRLSLRFLSWIVLNEIIQEDTHDSIQDALTALKLYKHYLKLNESNEFQDFLASIYEQGKNIQYKPPLKFK